MWAASVGASNGRVFKFKLLGMGRAFEQWRLRLELTGENTYLLILVALSAKLLSPCWAELN